jgi:predicted transcriptional regulator
MKTRSIEVDDDTATALTQRAAERGVSVPELLAELITLEAGPAVAEVGNIAELDRRWRAFEAQDSIAANDEVVRWLESWGTPAFRSWRSATA